MPSVKSTVSGNISLISSWKCERKYDGGTPYFVFLSEDMPTRPSTEVTFRYSIPSGAQITSARIYATLELPYTGCSVLSANGNQLVLQSGKTYAAEITPPSGGNSITVRFDFKANGNKIDESRKESQLIMTDVYLQVNYIIPTSNSPVMASTATGMSIPPTSCCIFDPSTGKTYVFDGVVQIQHSMSMKMEEEPQKAEQFVNNAKNEPDKVTLDVVMSDVHSNSSALGGSASMNAEQSAAYNAGKKYFGSSGSSRSANALAILRELKESRKKISVVTPQYVHTDMLISSITCNQDDETPYGWSGQIVFQHAYAAVAAKATDNSNAKKAGDSTRTPSMVSGGLDGLINAVKSFVSW